MSFPRGTSDRNLGQEKKNFENRTFFSKVMCGIAIGHFFLGHPVHILDYQIDQRIIIITS